MEHTIFHLKKKDLVQVMSGKEKGKTGKVLRINQKKNRIISMQKEAVERQKEIVEEKNKNF